MGRVPKRHKITWKKNHGSWIMLHSHPHLRAQHSSQMQGSEQQCHGYLTAITAPLEQLLGSWSYYSPGLPWGSPFQADVVFLDFHGVDKCIGAANTVLFRVSYTQHGLTLLGLTGSRAVMKPCHLLPCTIICSNFKLWLCCTISSAILSH